MKLTCWEAQQISKGVNKAALFYVKGTVNVHTVLFYVWAQIFLLVSCSITFQHLLCLYKVEANKQKKQRKKHNKEIGQFHKSTSPALSTMV